MKGICLDELKKIELDTLIYIDRVCKENNIRYSLCGGTLLGAIRHKGFIPWDDDIDIMIPRPDYDRFVQILDCSANKYKILFSGHKKYYYNFAKVVDSDTKLIEHNCQPIENMGVYVDVFPLDGVPSDSVVREKHFYKLYKLKKRINNFALVKPKVRKHLIKYLKAWYDFLRNKMSNLLKLQKRYEILAKQYNYDESEYVYMTGGAYGKKEVFPKSFVEGYETKMFENREFATIKEFDSYLSQLYGNYMEFPPEEKRVTHHHFSAEYR